MSTCALKQAKQPEAMQHNNFFSHLLNACLGREQT